MDKDNLVRFTQKCNILSHILLQIITIIEYPIALISKFIYRVDGGFLKTTKPMVTRSLLTSIWSSNFY